MNEEIRKVVARIQKMLAIANDERANPNEAAAAASQAEKMMRKYQIDHAAVMAEEFKDADNFETMDCHVAMKRDVGHRPKHVPPWGQWLAAGVAKLYDCHCNIISPAEGGLIRFYGYAADVACAAWTFNYLVGATIRSCRQFQKPGPDGVKRTKPESASFRNGFVIAVCRKITFMVEERERELQEATLSRALVVLKRDAVQERFGEFNYKSGNHKIGHDTYGAAFAAGIQEGKKVDVGRQAIGANGVAEVSLLA